MPDINATAARPVFAHALSVSLYTGGRPHSP